MANKQMIGLRYCGGCNPRYDRVALTRTLGQFFPEAELVNAEGGVVYPAIVVVCGCASRCAVTADLENSSDQQIWVTGREDLPAARDRLAQLLSTLRKN